MLPLSERVDSRRGSIMETSVGKCRKQTSIESEFLFLEGEVVGPPYVFAVVTGGRRLKREQEGCTAGGSDIMKRAYF